MATACKEFSTEDSHAMARQVECLHAFSQIVGDSTIIFPSSTRDCQREDMTAVNKYVVDEEVNGEKQNAVFESANFNAVNVHLSPELCDTTPCGKVLCCQTVVRVMVSGFDFFILL